MARRRIASLTMFLLRTTRSFETQPAYKSINRYVVQTHGQSSISSINHGYHTSATRCMGVCTDSRFGVRLELESPMDTSYRRSNQVNSVLSTLTTPHFRSGVPLIAMGSFMNHRSYSSSSSSTGGECTRADATAASGANSDSGFIGSDWVDKLKDGWQSAMDAATYTGQKAKEASSGLSPYYQQLLDANPYLNDVVVPIGYTLTGTALAWFVMPKVLRRFHKYTMQGPAAVFVGNIPYEKSFWGALEDPVRSLITFMAFSQIGMMIAPTTIAADYIQPAWRGAVILSFIWFSYRWKTNLLDRALTSQNLTGINREKLLTLDRVTSVGLFALGTMAFAEACGVAVQSILTVGGIGGVATAFAARDILGNILSGFSMQFSKPFSLGDTIKAGSIEGQVVEMGLTTTSLLNAEKFPVIVPNSLFSNQVIVNKSRAQWRAFVTKVPLQIKTLDKIPGISEDIKTMLKSNTKVSLDKELPYCFLSRIDSSSAELTLGCNLKHMGKSELYNTQQEILLQSVQLIKNHGGSLGITAEPDTTSI